jgi:phage tail-like protein
VSGAPAFAFLDLRAAGLRPLLDGTAITEAGIALAPVPGGGAVLADGLEPPALAGPAGIGVAPDGTVYVAEPDRGRVLRLPYCGGAAEPLPCVALGRPRGVAVVGGRGWLLVADAAGGRIVVIDLASGAVRESWGDGVLVEPWDLALDGAGRIYVADPGAGRVWRLDRDAPASARPAHVAISPTADGERLLVLDRARPLLRVHRLDGTRDAAATAGWRSALGGLAPSALAAGGLEVYVGDRRSGRVLAFAADGRLIGPTGWHGGCAGLAIDAAGRLLVRTGEGAVRLDAGPGTEGAFRLGPFAVGAEAPAWRRLQILDADLPEGSHVRLFTLTTSDPGLLPPALPDGPGGAGAWRAAPADALDCFIGGERAPWLWVGGRLQAGTGGTPVLGSLRAEYDGEGWLRHLPAVYSRPREARDVLDKALAALESALDEEERLVDDLPLLFDPATTPDAAGAEWLDWLAGWLAFELEAGPVPAGRRQLVGEAFALQGLRGTAAGLRRLLELELGAVVDVVEPAAGTSIWSLGHDGTALGVGTALAAAEPDGAVLGTTATLERSHLIAAEDHGIGLYADLAHRFCVRARAADLTRPGARETLERIVERERPAHAPAHVCVIEPRARVGFQATLGVDAIVGGSQRATRHQAVTGRIGETALGAGARVG